MFTKISTLLLTFFFLFSCRFIVFDKQQIPIDIYNDFDDNVQLANAIAGYDPVYLFKDSLSNNFNIFMENARVSSHQHFSNGEKAVFIRITYNLKNDEFKKIIDDLKPTVERIYLKLIQEHLSKNEEFIKVRQYSDSWIKNLRDSEIDKCWSNVGKILKESISKKQFEEIIIQIARTLNEAEKVESSYEQFYRQFSGVPVGEYFSVFYKIESEDNVSIPLRLSIEKKNHEYKVIGFQLLQGKEGLTKASSGREKA